MQCGGREDSFAGAIKPVEDSRDSPLSAVSMAAENQVEPEFSVMLKIFRTVDKKDVEGFFKMIILGKYN